jgi:hypothetical protein
MNKKIKTITTQTFRFHQMRPSVHPIPRLGAYSPARNSSTGGRIGDFGETETCCIPDWALAYETQGYF